MRSFPVVHEGSPYLNTARFEGIPLKNGGYIIRARCIGLECAGNEVWAADKVEAVALLETLEAEALAPILFEDHAP